MDFSFGHSIRDEAKREGAEINSLLRFEFLGKENRIEYGDFAIPKKLKFSKSLSLKC